MEVGRRRENGLIGGVGGGGICETMPSSAHGESMTLSARSKAITASAYYGQPRSLNNKYIRQRQHFLKG